MTHISTNPRHVSNLGRISADKARVRSYSLQNRLTPRLSRVCERKDCNLCTSLNCTCECHGVRR